MDKIVQRAELLHIADYDLPRFKAVTRRKQMPHTGFNDSAKGYHTLLAIILVVGDTLVSKTDLSRDEYADFKEIQLVQMLNGFRAAIAGDGDWIGFRRMGGANDIAFGKRDDVYQKLSDEKATSLSLIKIGSTFRAMRDRAEEIRPGLMDFAD